MTSTPGPAVPKAPMTRYVVAADGGNSKTDLVLATTGGRVLARVRGGGTNPQRSGFDGLAAQLAELTAMARREAGIAGSASVEVGVFHLANLDLPGEERAAARELRRLSVAEQIVAANDVFAVLRAGSDRGWGVAVVGGAGVNAVGLHSEWTDRPVSRDRRAERRLGWWSRGRPRRAGRGGPGGGRPGAPHRAS